MPFAQAAHRASFPQMPHNAVAAGGVEYILSPEEIADPLAHLRHVTFLQEVKMPLSPEEETQEPFASILRLLRTRTGIDFLSYKPATLRRRLDHRMAMGHLDQVSAYAPYLREHHLEVEALCKDLLIHVTSFFRDQQGFETLARLAFPPLVHGRPSEHPLSIWMPV